IKHFSEALRYNPLLTPDPVTWSPKVRAAFESARSLFLKQEEQRQKMELTWEAVVCRNASWRSLILPGWGQYYRQEKVRAAIYSGWAILSLSVLIYAQYHLPSAREKYRSEQNLNQIEDRWQTYRDLYRLRVVSFNSLLTSYLISFLDALYRPIPPKKLPPSPYPSVPY
ncbi:MAG: DUF5683 domain-containing protein, partial [bacterium]